MIKIITHGLYYKIYSLHAHCGLVFYKRWKWKKHLMKGNVDTLEVGNGGGPWTIELLRMGNKVTSVDISVIEIDRLKKKLQRLGLYSDKRIRLVHSHIKDFKTSEVFDQITLFEVLEHIKEDQKVIINLAKMLKPGGHMLISTPSSDYIPFYGEGSISDIEDGGHVRKGYSFEDFEILLKNAGLKIVFKDCCAGYFTQKLHAIERILSVKLSSNILFRIIVNLLFRPLTWLDILKSPYPRFVNFIIAKKEQCK